ncbi:response regulator [Flavobacteriaceae bacterium F89]|uniref:Response regulator n=1 Tax=Cerina litoralis TaxID=2874477 RepID=A0AAE3JUJ7_9FLAO|nr:response regulator [Cerina litoralis]MCG2462467.1 response regulator [Cerina litoralis]
MITGNHIIYLADDDEDDRQLFTEALKELPFELQVTTFSNGVDLMSRLLDPDAQLPDIIFLDLNMPLMNGEECLADIRDEQKLCKIPIVIYSTSFDVFKVKLLQKKGADRYLQKPRTYSQLKLTVQKAIESLSKQTSVKVEKEEFVIRS